MTTFSDQRPDPQLDDLVSRLRVWSLSSWQYGDRVARVLFALQQLADLAADAEQRRRIAVPELSPMALADQLAVLADDARAAGAAEEVGPIVARLAGELGLTG